ncbi:MAG: pyridoxal phosphate-dependent aminotransferase [Planctomycetota bacterium]|jgi:aspartate aminotransferase/aminotransferase
MNTSKFIADQIAGIGASGIRRVFELGATLKDPINLSIGQPDFPVPESIKNAMIEAIRDNRNGYTVTRGVAPLRDRLTEKLRNDYDWDPDVFAISGLSGGLLLVLLACLNRGDEVLIGDPYFVSYPHLVNLIGGTPVLVDLYDDFQLDPEKFEAAITNKTKIVLLCSPSNPTGTVYRPDDLKAVCEIARKHDLLIVMDEIYNSLSYDTPNPSAASFAPERTIMLRGFGKSHAMTGLRIGYAAGPHEIIGEMAKLQQYTFVCAPQPAQWGALAALDADMSEQIADYRRKRDHICQELTDIYEFVKPTGGFYLFAKVPGHFPNATDFVDEAIRHNMLIIPGEVFSQRDTHFRISYAAPDETIRRGCEVLRDMAAR